MRSVSSAVLLLLLGCGPSNEEAKREFADLERSLTAVSAAPADDWPGLLDEIRKLPLTDPAVLEVRTQCGAAYAAYTTATAQLSEARSRVATVETETRKLTDGDGGLPTPALGKLHRRAAAATDDVGASLDKAQQLVESCRTLRAELRAKLADQ